MVSKELIDYVNEKTNNEIMAKTLHAVCGSLLLRMSIIEIKMIVDSVFESYDPHEVSKVVCSLCGYKWIAVRPLGTDKLECKQCGNICDFENINN